VSSPQWFAGTRSFVSFNYSLGVPCRSEGINRRSGFRSALARTRLTHAVSRATEGPLFPTPTVSESLMEHSETSLDSSSFCALVNLIIVGRNSDGTDIARARHPDTCINFAHVSISRDSYWKCPSRANINTTYNLSRAA